LMIKCLRNGNILVQESKTFDIIEYSPVFKELKRVKGIAGIAFDQEGIRSSRHSHDETTIPWMKGNGDLSLISLKDFSMREVNKFFGPVKSDDLVPLLVVCSKTGDKVFGISTIKEEVRICYYEKGSGSKFFGIGEKFTRCNLL
jgi:hypothetical protein